MIANCHESRCINARCQVHGWSGFSTDGWGMVSQWRSIAKIDEWSDPRGGERFIGCQRSRTHGILQTFEELPPLDNVVAPPVKPKNGSNPRINVTLAPVDERTPRRLYTTPMEVTELVNNNAENLIPPPKAAVETIGSPLILFGLDYLVLNI